MNIYSLTCPRCQNIVKSAGEVEPGQVGICPICAATIIMTTNNHAVVATCEMIAQLPPEKVLLIIKMKTAIMALNRTTPQQSALN